MFTVGMGVGSLVFPFFADKYGRKPVTLFASIFLLVSALGVAFSQNYPMLLAFRFLDGVFNQALLQTCVTLEMEVLATRHRAIMFGGVGCINWGFAMMSLSPIAFLLKDVSWRWIEGACCCFFIHILLQIIFLDESFRWVVANEKTKKVSQTLKKASRWNRKNVDVVVSAFYQNESSFEKLKNKKTDKVEHQTKSEKSFLNTFQENTEKIENKISENSSNSMLFQKSDLKVSEKLIHSTEETEEKVGLKHLFVKSMLRMNLIFCCFGWCINSLTYYALLLMSSTQHGNLYINFAINCAMEFPGSIFIALFMDKIGRKWCFGILSFFAGLTLLVSAILRALEPEEEVAITVLNFIGKMAVSGSYAILFTYTPELFPTNVRNMAVGISSIGARIGGMLSPFAELLMKRVVYAPGVIFGTGCLVLSFLTYYIPETTGHQLPQTIEEMESWYKDKNNKSSEKQ